jgi:hypothetical protein
LALSAKRVQDVVRQRRDRIALNLRASTST